MYSHSLWHINILFNFSFLILQQACNMLLSKFTYYSLGDRESVRAFKQVNGINFTVTKKASFPREPQGNETTELPCRLSQTTCWETHGWKQACLSAERLGLTGSSWGRLSWGDLSSRGCWLVPHPLLVLPTSLPMPDTGLTGWLRQAHNCGARS